MYERKVSRRDCLGLGGAGLTGVVLPSSAAGEVDSRSSFSGSIVAVAMRVIR